MANRFFSPDQQFLSNSGVPYAGGFLYFYATGTSTPQNTYSDNALTIANTNPVVLDSNGQAGSVFLQNLAYKVVLTDSNLVQIWTMDPVYSSDYSTFAAFKPWNGNPNGFVAGTAGTVGTLPGTSAIWDYVDNILYVCTTTGNAASAVWTAINASSATPATPPPQGYLTLSSDSSNPILTVDAISSTSVYYTPYVGNLVPVYNGASFITTAFTQLVLTLSASQAISTLYDVFVFSNAGVLTLVTGPAWSVSTAGSGSRGTGASTTQIQRLNGLWVNQVQITGRNGATAYTIPANTATYVGSLFMDTVAGQITCHRSYGQSRKWGVWNAYNRVPTTLLAGDSTSSWAYASTTTIRPSNNNVANSLTLFSGLAEEEYSLEFHQNAGANITGTVPNTLIGFNSVTTGSGVAGGIVLNFGAAQNLIAEHDPAPSLGIQVVTQLEAGATSGTVTFNGGLTNSRLVARWRT